MRKAHHIRVPDGVASGSDCGLLKLAEDLQIQSLQNCTHWHNAYSAGSQ